MCQHLCGLESIMTKINFLFWNIKNLNPSLEKILSETIRVNNIDVLIFAENLDISDESDFIRTNSFESVTLYLENSTKKWIKVFYKENSNYNICHHTQFIEYEDANGEIIENNISARTVNRVQIFKISGSVKETFFACIHFPSKLYHDENTHLQLVPNYKTKIHDYIQNSDRVFVVGDFNMNPFDLGMVEPNGFFAHNNRNLIKNDSRVVHGQNHISYYNPCWTLLGDFINKSDYSNSQRSGGSFYYKQQKSRAYYWHIIDQLIMRKSLINEFCSESLEIIENTNLIEQIQMETNRDMDHFPLKFSFNFK